MVENDGDDDNVELLSFDVSNPHEA